MGCTGSKQNQSTQGEWLQEQRTLSQEEQICDISVNQDGVILN